MGVLLERARRAFGGSAPELPAAEPFEVVCVCGERVRGFRLDHRQFVPCSVCGALHLVLPVSSYPRPLVYETPTEPEQVKVEVVQPVRPMGVRVRVGLGQASRSGARFLWGLVPPARWFSAVRLTIMGTLLVVAATLWLTVYWSGRGTLASDTVTLRAAATSDIEAGDFAQAQQKLERAALAMRRFSGHTRESREINQLAAEVSCIVDLLDRPLEEVLRHRKSISADESERYFRDTLKNSVLLMDTHISPKPESEPGTYRVDSPLVFGPDTVWVDISKLKLFGTWSEAGPIRVLFAARIVTIDSGPAAGEWTVRLAPDSGVLITWSLCAERLGWPLDEPTRALLDSQTKREIDLP